MPLCVSSNVSPNVPQLVSFWFLFHEFSLIYTLLLLLLCLLSLWFIFVFSRTLAYCIFQVCLKKARLLFPYPPSHLLSAFGPSPCLPIYNNFRIKYFCIVDLKRWSIPTWMKLEFFFFFFFFFSKVSLSFTMSYNRGSDWFLAEKNHNIKQDYSD